MKFSPCFARITDFNFHCVEERFFHNLTPAASSGLLLEMVMLPEKKALSPSAKVWAPRIATNHCSMV
jgi:hypothetical protein